MTLLTHPQRCSNINVPSRENEARDYFPMFYASVFNLFLATRPAVNFALVLMVAHAQPLINDLSSQEIATHHDHPLKLN